MTDDPMREKTLWQTLKPLNIWGLFAGVVAYFIRLQFNISIFARYADLEDANFSWVELTFGFVLPCLALANFFGYFIYLQNSSGKK